ncbi:MAG TPA: hypothetical protein DCO79_15330 [Spirochaeta sp.]|nr:hypothetical protein [Spirochaeta sp.]
MHGKKFWDFKIIMNNDNVKYAVLGSGSSANSYIFEYNDFAIIIDNGFSAKQAVERAVKLGFNTENVKYLLLTHSHEDHFRGIEVLSRKLRVPVIVHEDLNVNRKLKTHFYKRRDIQPGLFYTEGDFRFRAFQTSHDADYSISYHFELGGLVFTIISDTGAVSEEMLELASKSDILFLEANYNEKMLHEGPYPLFLKQRIASNQGHLSNTEAVHFLNEAGMREGSKLTKVYFCHLSSTNNTPAILTADIEEHLQWPGEWVICRKGEPVACN